MDKMISEVLSKYGIRPKKCTLIKQDKKGDRCVWEVHGEKGKYALKSVDAKKAQTISNVSRHFSDKGIPVIPVLPALNGDFVVQKDKSSFILFPWFEGKHLHYETPGTIERMSTLLAQFHEASKGFKAAGKRIKKSKLNLLQEYSGKIETMNKLYKNLGSSKDPVERVFSEHYFWIRKRCDWVIKTLPSTSYKNLIALAKSEPILGHGDYSRANVLSDEAGNWKIIDFDTVAVSLPLRDISRMITWINHDLSNWDPARYQSILQSYRNARPFSEEEEKLLIVDQCFPHQAITLMNRYYRKDRNKYNFLEELTKCLATDKEKIRELSIKELGWNSA